MYLFIHPFIYLCIRTKRTHDDNSCYKAEMYISLLHNHASFTCITFIPNPYVSIPINPFRKHLYLMPLKILLVTRNKTKME